MNALSTAAALACAALALASAAADQPRRTARGGDGGRAPQDRWELKYTEDFRGSALNAKLWSRIDGDPASGADWLKNMSARPDLVEVSGGVARLKGVRNTDAAADPRRVLAGGISTRGKFNVLYGRIEARIRLSGRKGAWPAFWMMPESPESPWPRCGEIDILERLNFDPFVYQTVHSAWTQTHPQDPPHGGKGAIRPEGWNVYSVDWTPDEIVWRVNGRATHSYRRAGDGEERWPWNRPFYVMIDMQLGGRWVGPVDESALPAVMEVDWVKFYHLVRDGRRVSEFTAPGRRAPR